MKILNITLSVLLVSLTAGCATPTVVQTKQANDSAMTCDQLKAAHSEAAEFEAKARKEKYDALKTELKNIPRPHF